MKAVVLCPGPSLAKFTGCEHLTIGVNRAGLNKQVGPSYAETLGRISGFACDWWAATDYPLIRDYQALGKPKLFTSRQTANDIKGKFDHLFSGIAAKEDIGVPFNEVPWTIYTATSALVLAYHLGATEIEVYGCDFAGVADWDGHSYQWKGNEAWRTRGGAKWDAQAANWKKTVEFLAGKGVTVTHGST